MSDALQFELQALGKKAKAASRQLRMISAAQKNRALASISKALLANEDIILEANAQDVRAAEAKGISSALLDRLRLDAGRIQKIANAVAEVQDLPDPVGEVLSDYTRPNGLNIRKIRVPIGVIAIIYESRPNVTVDAAVLCLKAGNDTLLRGGSEAFGSNQALTHAVQQGLQAADISPDAVQLVPSTDRRAIEYLCMMRKCIDVIIPRGGPGLIDLVSTQARMPVIKHDAGLCIAYVHEDADFAMAQNIIVNGKTQRPGVCNALETLLVDRAIAAPFLPQLAAVLRDKGVEIRANAEAFAILTSEHAKLADLHDFESEFLDLILAVKVVGDSEEALDHISQFSSGHSDVIITSNESVAQHFLQAVDSATVYWNASTRFTDGGEFGFGAEIGISTDKLHARGPMGLPELTTYTYLLHGSGQVRS
ncbi:MAG: glutamate-5-semialdehyde dehydrogenase [Verrucomicrobiales bacterium]